MLIADTVSRRVQAIQADLVDLHDPQGVYFHRAWNACLVTLIAAVGLFFVPTIAQPLLVIAALCFMLITSPRDRPGYPITLLGSLIVVLLSTALLILTQFQPILQAVVLIGLGFLVHYLPQFGSAFAGGLFVWVLSLLASAGNTSVGKLPETLLNIILGWLIVYLCYFWISPYQPYPVLLSLLKRTRLRLAERLHQVVEDWAARSGRRDGTEVQRNDDLDQRIVSVIAAQHALLKTVGRKRQASKSAIAHDRQIIDTYEDLFEAILVLEQSLKVLQNHDPLPSQLQAGLLQLSQQTLQVLEQSLSLQSEDPSLQLDDQFEQWLQAWVADAPVASAPHLQRRNTQQSIHTLVSKINAVACLPFAPERTTDVP